MGYVGLGIKGNGLVTGVVTRLVAPATVDAHVLVSKHNVIKQLGLIDIQLSIDLYG